MQQQSLHLCLLASLLTATSCNDKPPSIPDQTAAKKIDVDSEDVRSRDASPGDFDDAGGADAAGEAERSPTITGEADSRVLDAPCTQGDSGPQIIEVDHFGSPSDSFEVKTEWCLKGKEVGRLRAMFLVDHSGSMMSNDPLVSDGCGRLSAAMALIDKLKSQMQESDEVEVAAVTFGSRAETVSSFIPIDDFTQSHLNADVFCGAVDQTNYQGALQAAMELVNATGDRETPVAAYLLSDGLPSLGSEQSPQDYVATEQSALSAARSFLAIENVSLNAVYLQATQPAGTTLPESYLAELTGKPDKVTIVSNAQDLSASITKFELPAPGTNLTTATATVTGKGKPRSIALKSVTPDPSSSNKVLVTTERFKLTEADEEESDRYFIKLKIDVDDGTIQQTTIVIKIKAE